MSERERFEEGMPGLLKAMRWAYDNFYVKGYSNGDEREGYISALEDDLPVLFGQVDDLVALVARLVRSLRKAAPGDALADGAMDYLRRKGLNPSPLRTVPEPGQAASGSSQGARSDDQTAKRIFPPEPDPMPSICAGMTPEQVWEYGHLCGWRAGQPEAPTAAPLPKGWDVIRKDDLFKTIIVIAPNGYSAVTTAMSRNPENVLRMLVEDIAHPPARSGAGSEEGRG